MIRDNERVLKFANPVLIVRHLWQFRDLIWLIAKREVLGRYKGSLGGMGWSFVQPLIMLCVYTFVFSVIFNARWGMGPNESRLTFALVLFLGIITYGLFSEMVNSSPELILSNRNYVTKVLFPLEILPVARLFSTLIYALLSLIVLMFGVFIASPVIHWTLLLLPIVWLPMLFLSLGCGYFLASIGVFFRDLGATAGIVTTLLFFASPIFYPASAVPVEFRFLCKINPIAVFVEEARKVVFWGELPDWAGFFAWLSLSIFIWISGFICFMKFKKGFADVI